LALPSRPTLPGRPSLPLLDYWLIQPRWRFERFIGAVLLPGGGGGRLRRLASSGRSVYLEIASAGRACVLTWFGDPPGPLMGDGRAGKSKDHHMFDVSQSNHQLIYLSLHISSCTHVTSFCSLHACMWGCELARHHHTRAFHKFRSKKPS
jgi:hypothetical protein